MVSCTEDDVTVEFLDYGNEAVLYDSQKVEEIQFKWTLKRVPQLRKLPEEWEKFPAMAVEVELGLETSSDEDYLAFLMDEAVQTFNQKEERCWVWNPHIGLIWDLILHFSSLQVEVSAMTGPGEVTGHIVGHEGRPIYQGLVREGIVKMSSCSYFELIREISALHICSSVT